MENPEEILHSLEEFAKMKPKDIPRELEEYLKFVAKTGDPIYQWPAIKSLFREKLISVITEFYESCTSMEIPPCPNVEMFNYDLMKTFILEKLDTFASAPFTLQRICELLTSPRKEYTRIDKYMRALEKNILVVSTMEPCGRRTENGEGIMNGLESDHETVPDPANEINVEEMDDFNAPSYVQASNHITEHLAFDNATNGTHIEIENTVDTFASEKVTSEASTSSQEIVCVQYVSIEPVDENLTDEPKESTVSLTITAINVKDVETNVEEPAPIPTESTEMTMEDTHTAIPETEDRVQMESEPIEAATHSEAISSTEVDEKTIEDLEQPEVCSKNEPLAKNLDNENNSEDDSSISSSECESSTSVEIQLSNLSVEKAPIASVDLLETPSAAAVEDNLASVVDSTTRGTGDASADLESEEKVEAGDGESPSSAAVMDLQKNCALEQSPRVESTENDNCDAEKPCESIPEEPLKVVETNEVSIEPAEAKETQPGESIVEEVSSFSQGDEETPMEVDIVDESASKEAETADDRKNS